jgi:hypothetical protein
MKSEMIMDQKALDDTAEPSHIRRQALERCPLGLGVGERTMGGVVVRLVLQ